MQDVHFRRSMFFEQILLEMAEDQEFREFLYLNEDTPFYTALILIPTLRDNRDDERVLRYGESGGGMTPSI